MFCWLKWQIGSLFCMKIIFPIKLFILAIIFLKPMYEEKIVLLKKIYHNCIILDYMKIGQPADMKLNRFIKSSQ